MSCLEILLWAKMIITILLWGLPLVLLPQSFMKKMGLVTITPPVFGRLLGVAYLALAVAYGSGIIMLRQGQWIQGIVWMGLVSNGGASFFLWLSCLRGDWKKLSSSAKVFMWISALIVSAVFAGFLVWGLGR